MRTTTGGAPPASPTCRASACPPWCSTPQRPLPPPATCPDHWTSRRRCTLEQPAEGRPRGLRHRRMARPARLAPGASCAFSRSATIPDAQASRRRGVMVHRV
jgi:hypothetical protein